MNKLLHNTREWFDAVKNTVTSKLVRYSNGKHGLLWKTKDSYYMH